MHRFSFAMAFCSYAKLTDMHCMCGPAEHKSGTSESRMSSSQVVLLLFGENSTSSCFIPTMYNEYLNPLDHQTRLNFCRWFLCNDAEDSRLLVDILFIYRASLQERN